jgi:hypothetical protein
MARLAAAEKAAASAKEEVERLKQAHETLAAKNKQLFDQVHLGPAPTRPHGRSRVKQIPAALLPASLSLSFRLGHRYAQCSDVMWSALLYLRCCQVSAVEEKRKQYRALDSVHEKLSKNYQVCEHHFDNGTTRSTCPRSLPPSCLQANAPALP